MVILFVLIWIVCAVACASIASAKGHSGCLWGVLGLVFGFFALLVIAVVPAHRPPVPMQVTIRNDPVAATAPLPSRGEKRCPDCAETVLLDARVCRHCGYRFDGTGSTKAVESRPAEPVALAYDEDQRAAATVLRALAEAAMPLRATQEQRIIELVSQMRGWGRLGPAEFAAATTWLGSHETDQAGLRAALERVAKWNVRQTVPLLAAAQDVAGAGGTPAPGGSERQTKFLALVRQIAGSKAG